MSKEILLGVTQCLGEGDTAEETTHCLEESAGVDVVSCCGMAMTFDHLTSLNCLVDPKSMGNNLPLQS